MSLRRLPIRLRVTLAFTVAMALLIAALGTFIWLEMRSRLDESVDDTLRARFAEISALAPFHGLAPGYRRYFGTREGATDETFVQVLRSDGEVALASAIARRRPLLTPAQARAASRGPISVDRVAVAGFDGDARLLAAPLPGRSPNVVVVGTTLDDRDRTLSNLLTLLLVGGPVALAIASGAGYLVAGRALGPVETMRRRAQEISAAGPGERLPVPEADDELRRLGETLNEMLARLEAALERERRFADDASHELRTPLALHRAELELALRYGDDAGELRSAIASAVEEVDRLVQLAEDLLVVARAGEGELELDRRALAVPELFATLRERFAARAQSAGRPLRFRDPGPVRIHADRLRAEQAVTGLLDNALRHGEGAVCVQAHAMQGRIEIHVRDEGPGFPPGFLPHAFERFSRADGARGRGGSGLGLAIVQAIAMAHGGRAVAANAPDGGADAWVELPSADGGDDLSPAAGP